MPPGPILVVAGAGLGQDPGPHAPPRLPDRRARRLAVRDPRDHVHQQGRGRDARARGRARRAGCPADVGVDVPRRVLPDPAPRGEPARLPLELHDLRPGRRGPPHRLDPPRPEPRPQALPGPPDPLADQRPEERAGAPARVRGRWRSARPSGALSEIYTEYQRRLQEASALDFDDLLVLAVRLFREHPEALERYRSRFRHVLVDEFQDTNAAQWELVRLLTQEHRSVMVVGDLDQSIYKFRGADFRNLLKFEEQFPDAVTVVLDQNYRSSQRILDAANAVIENNASHRPKHLWTDRGRGRADRSLPGRRRARRSRVRRARDPSPDRRR